MKKIIGFIVSGLLLCASPVYADIERVSVSSTGIQGNKPSGGPSISADGRYAAFLSAADNLVEGDTNDPDGVMYSYLYDVFVRDRDTGVTQRVSVSSSGEQANGSSGHPSISADGRYVTFPSSATNLVQADTNGFSDIFVHDRTTKITQRINVSSTGAQTNKSSGSPIISSDGRFVVFNSEASNLVEADTNGRADIFVHDRISGITERVNLSSTAEQANSFTGSAKISADGRIVVFSSNANNLVVGDTNGVYDIFTHDRSTGLTERVSVSSSGEQANFLSLGLNISADGRFVAFQSSATNLVNGGDANGRGNDIYVHDRNTGITERVNVSSSGVQGNEHSDSPSISADGRFVTFSSNSSNLVKDDTNGTYDTFVHDRSTGLTKRASVSSNGEQGNVQSGPTSISDDGRYLGIFSYATNLVEGDTNGVSDAFVAVNELADSERVIVTVRKLINNAVRDTQETAAKLSTGTLYRQDYIVSNQSLKRIYQVRVYEAGNLVCNFYALNPGESKQRCISYQTVIEGDQHSEAMVTAKVSGSAEVITDTTDAFYTGLSNIAGKLTVTYLAEYPDSNISTDADTPDQALLLDSSQANVVFKVENTGQIELYQVRTYHDPVSPVNNGWALQCVLGSLKPGKVRYCKRNISFAEAGLNQTMGRVQGRNAIRSATEVVNASNPTYFLVP